MRSATSSGFNASDMPSCIRPRTLLPFSVHYSGTTGRWIATIHMRQNPEESGANLNPARNCLHFSFETEREAGKFAKAYSPPWLTPLSQSATCFICRSEFKGGNAYNCRNCGVCVCDKCCAKWGTKMVPKTYTLSAYSQNIRVCKSCDWLSNAFCMALLRGRFSDALAFYDTGNVNLRCTFADINKEAMFPVHCAALGGNLNLLRWLVETHACPITARKTSGHAVRPCSILTSNGRSLMDLAMTGKPKIDILRYLVVEKNMSVSDTKNPKLAQVTLDAFLRSGRVSPVTEGDLAIKEDRNVANVIEIEKESLASDSVDDACALCCEQSMDCVLIPCGHQVCCTKCGQQLDCCPVCKVKCSVLRIFRQ